MSLLDPLLSDGSPNWTPGSRRSECQRDSESMPSCALVIEHQLGVVRPFTAGSGARLIGMRASGVDLTGSRVVASDLSGVDLRGANLKLAGLVNVRLRNADISGSRVFGVAAWHLDTAGARQGICASPPTSPASRWWLAMTLKPPSLSTCCCTTRSCARSSTRLERCLPYDRTDGPSFH